MMTFSLSSSSSARDRVRATDCQSCSCLAQPPQERASLVRRLSDFEKMPEHMLLLQNGQFRFGQFEMIAGNVLIGGHSARMNVADEKPFRNNADTCVV
jgi:hypothetical protein